MTKILVDRSSLSMVINALRRDANEGRHIRGEIADELVKTCEPIDDYVNCHTDLIALKKKIETARNQIKMMIHEIPKTVGDINLSLLMEDLEQVDRLLGE